MNSMSESRAKLIVVLGVVGVSLSAIFVRYASAPSMVLVFYRLGFSALFMTVPGIRSLYAEREVITKKDLLCCLVSGVFLALHFYAYFTAVKLTSIAAAVVLVDVEVFFVSFAMIFFLRERIGRTAWLGIGITFFGSILITLGDGLLGGSLKGDLWALSGAFFVAVYTLMGRICRRHMSTASYTTVVYWVTALTALALLAVQGISPLGWPWQDAACGLGMTVFCTLLGHSVFSWALKRISPAYISTVKLLEPVFASILGVFLFAEIPGWYAIVGGIVVILGVYLTGKSTPEKKT